MIENIVIVVVEVDVVVVEVVHVAIAEVVVHVATVVVRKRVRGEIVDKGVVEVVVVNDGSAGV